MEKNNHVNFWWNRFWMVNKSIRLWLWKEKSVWEIYCQVGRGITCFQNSCVEETKIRKFRWKKNNGFKQKHSTFAEKKVAKPANPLKGWINANEWERGQMEGKQANMFGFHFIGTFQNIKYSCIQMFSKSNKLGERTNWTETKNLIDGKFQQKVFWNIPNIWIPLFSQAAERLWSCRIIHPCRRLQVINRLYH